jgi:energy-converting hydrogenase Eha subunit C
VNDTPRIVEIASLLTVAGVSVYVLGLVVLALSIRLFFKSRWDTAWYAVSLLPRTAVAGQGVRIWRGSTLYLLLLWIPAVAALIGTPFPYLLVITIAAITLVSILIVLRAIQTIRLAFTAAITAAMVEAYARGYAEMMVGGIVDPILTTLFPKKEETEEERREKEQREKEQREKEQQEKERRDRELKQERRRALRTKIPLALLGASVVVIGSYTTIQGLQLKPNDPLHIVVHWDSVIGGLIVFLIGAFFVGVTLAESIASPLPTVVLTVKKEGKNATEEEVRGYLVAHTEGCWHLFKMNSEGDSERTLTFIPDAQVTEARV